MGISVRGINVAPNVSPLKKILSTTTKPFKKAVTEAFGSLDNGAEETQSNESPPEKLMAKKRKKIKSKSTNLSFPIDIEENPTYSNVMQLLVIEEKRVPIGNLLSAGKKATGAKETLDALVSETKSQKDAFIKSNNNLRNSAAKDTAKTNLNIVKTIYLPIPNQLKYDESQSWGDIGKELGSTKIAGDLLTGGASGAEQALIQGITTAAIAVSEKAGVGYSEEYSTKQVKNPMKGFIFNSTEERAFAFSYKFMIRSEAEGRLLKELIKTLRSNSAPEVVNGQGRLSKLRFPNIFIPNFLTREVGSGSLIENKFLPKIRQCFVTSVNTNVTINGLFASLADGVPTEVDLAIGFKENRTITRADIEEGF